MRNGQHILRRAYPRDLKAATWAALRTSAEPQTIAQIAEAAGDHPHLVQTRVSNWMTAGLVASVPGRPARYHLTDKAGAEPPAKTAWTASRGAATGRARMWAAMRVLRRFDVPSLAIAAEQTHACCLQFVNQLVCSGYVVVERQLDRRTGEGESYRLVRPSGPLPPAFSQRLENGALVKVMRDRNDGRSYPVAPRLGSRSAVPTARGGVS